LQDRTHKLSYYNPQFDILEDHGTTHLSVIDQWGGAVSLTTTVNLIFGSRVMDTKTGIILNDEMDDFSTPGLPDAFGLRREHSFLSFPNDRHRVSRS
jgi:gamma-glutamyltranspeptidase/glutathione hydrolase/leukotriene-C4 hydrolase